MTREKHCSPQCWFRHVRLFFEYVHAAKTLWRVVFPAPGWKNVRAEYFRSECPL